MVTVSSSRNLSSTVFFQRRIVSLFLFGSCSVFVFPHLATPHPSLNVCILLIAISDVNHAMTGAG
jgi:hypothetical protein